MKMLTLLLAIFAASACAAQLPDAPEPVKAYALNLGLESRYSFTNSARELAPRITFDYRLNNRFRVGVSYSHPVQLVQLAGPAPRQSNSVVVSLNAKILQWGKVR